MIENPYSAPSSDFRVSTTEHAVGPRPLLEIAREVFLAWEMLRIAYLITLTLFTVLMLNISYLWDLQVITQIIFGAVIANVAYFAGPTVETYIRWLGYDRDWPRWFMFIGGTLIALCLASAFITSALQPRQ